MICQVCKKSFEGDSCPRCKFPVIHFPGNTEDGMRSIEATVSEYRKGFLKSIDLGVLSYSWKDQDGVLVQDKRYRASFGKADSLIGKTLFLSEQFARIPDRKMLDIQVDLQLNGETRKITVPVPNLLEAELQQVGVEVTEDLRFRMLLRNGAGRESVSGYISIFE